MIGTGLELASGSLRQGRVHATTLALGIVFLYTGPLLAWPILRFTGSQPRTNLFNQGFLSGAVGFYGTMLILYFAIVGGIR